MEQSERIGATAYAHAKLIKNTRGFQWELSCMVPVVEVNFTSAMSHAQRVCEAANKDWVEKYGAEAVAE